MGLPRQADVVCAARLFYAERQKRRKEKELKVQALRLEQECKHSARIEQLAVHVERLSQCMDAHAARLGARLDEVDVRLVSTVDSLVVDASRQTCEILHEADAEFDQLHTRLDSIASEVTVFAARIDEGARHATVLSERQLECSDRTERLARKVAGLVVGAYRQTREILSEAEEEFNKIAMRVDSVANEVAAVAVRVDEGARQATAWCRATRNSTRETAGGTTASSRSCRRNRSGASANTADETWDAPIMPS